MVGRLKHKCNTGVNVFIAGSKSIQKERTKVREILSHYQSIKNVRVDTRTFEDFADYVNEDGQQTAYNKFIREKADVVIFVFTEHVGKKTVEEFDVAYDAYKEKQLPQILVFCDGNHIDKSRDAALIKIQEKMNKLGLYYKDYDNYDQLTNEINKNLDIVLGFVNIQAESNIDVHVISQNIAQTTKETIDGKERLVDEYGLLYEITSRFNPYKVSLVGVHPDATPEDVIVPNKIQFEGKTYAVTTIGNSAFRCCKSLSSICLPDGIITIGKDAFFACESLSTVFIPNSVITIGIYAFGGCKSLTSISLPNSVTTIEVCAFKDCRSLTSISLPNSVTTIEACAFENCRSLISISIPHSVTKIGAAACSGCEGLMSILLPNNITIIGDSVFAHCKSLTSISIPSGVLTIGECSFACCEKLTSIFIPSSVTTIGNYAFQGCKSLTSISIPNSVTKIGDTAFGHCWSLSSISIPSSVKTIGSGAFWDCMSLSSVSIPDSVTKIEDDTFSYCESLIFVDILGNPEFGKRVFEGCARLQYITISAQECDLRGDPLWDCPML